MRWSRTHKNSHTLAAVALKKINFGNENRVPSWWSLKSAVNSKLRKRDSYFALKCTIEWRKTKHYDAWKNANSSLGGDILSFHKSQSRKKYLAASSLIIVYCFHLPKLTHTLRVFVLHRSIFHNLINSHLGFFVFVAELWLVSMLTQFEIKLWKVRKRKTLLSKNRGLFFVTFPCSLLSLVVWMWRRGDSRFHANNAEIHARKIRERWEILASKWIVRFIDVKNVFLCFYFQLLSQHRQKRSPASAFN